MIGRKVKEERNLRLGVVTDYLNSPYHRRILEGITEFGKTQHVSFLYFVVGRLEARRDWEKYHNIVASFPDPSTIDGMILFISSMRNLVKEEYASKLLKKYRKVPIVTLSEVLPETPAVIVDNDKGMRELMEHMVVTHGYKRIAFLKGPENNVEAQTRFDIYKQVLKEHNISYDEELVFWGNFTYDSGRDAIKFFLDKKKVKMDAIVASNDNMALGALEEFQLRGLFASASIPITGYDDIDTSEQANLTTVRQPLFKQGYMAAEILYSMVSNNKSKIEVLKLEPELIVRESCGCFSSSVSSAMVSSHINTEDTKKNILGHEKEIINEINGADFGIQKRLLPWFRDHIEDLTREFIKEIVDKKVGVFLWSWKRLLTWAVNEKLNLNILQDLISYFRKLTLQCFHDLIRIYYVEDLFHQARIMLWEVRQKTEIMAKVMMQSENERLNDIGSELSTALNIEEQMNILYQEAISLKIDTFYLSLFKDISAPLKLSTLMLACINGTRIPIEKGGQVYPTLQIIPHGFWPVDDSVNLAIVELSHRAQPFGFIVFDYKPELGMIYESLRTKISISLDSAILVDKIRNQALYLEQEVKQRTKDLQQANYQLEIEIAERKRAEEILKRSEEKYREMTLLLPTIIFETDIDLQFIYINRAGLELFGLTDTDVKKGVSYLDYIPMEDRERVKEYCTRIIHGAQMGFNEFNLLKKDGSRINFLGKATPVYRDNVLEGLLWNVIDIRPLMSNIFMPDDSYFDQYGLSSREKEVFKLLIQGYKNKEIADRLFITEATVKDHAGAIYAKIGVKNREELFDKIKDLQVSRFGYHSYIFSLFARLLREN